ncbi:MAG: sigma-54 dependent transcriptional regulator [Elusimicrobiota bacterium]
MAAKILIVDDEELIRWSLSEGLGSAGYKALTAESAEKALALIEKEDLDVILTDLRLEGASGLELLKEARRLRPEIPVILMTAFADMDSAIEAIREGAADYIPKPLQLEGLKLTLNRVLETEALRSRIQEARRRRRVRYSFDSFVAASGAMREVLVSARKMAASPFGTILLLGESGTGKDRLARTIHWESPRSGQPLMEIGCASIPESLLESELFGYEKGAFTGATHRKKGLFEIAAGGTVFLNEIGHMPLGLQAKMLRVLEEKTFKRVGGGEDISVDVRVIAATNEDLENAVAEGRFRPDLYYRVNVLTVRLLPLRERREDILPLAESLLDRLCREMRRPKPALSERTGKALLGYPWPGNVRELRNALERMLILGETEFRPASGPAARPPADAAPAANALPEGVRHGAPAGVDAAPAPCAFDLPEGGIRLDAVEKSLVRQALERTGGNQVNAAKLLGIGRDALRRRVDKFGLKTG